MNWGHKIALLYISFVVMTLAFVFYFMGQKVDLVTDDYYKEEIQYQDQIDRVKNATSLKDPIDVSYSPAEKKVNISFPKSQAGDVIKGNIFFYRPSNSAEDRKFAIHPEDTGVQSIYVGSFHNGLWKIKILWSTGGKEYYYEKMITL